MSYNKKFSEPGEPLQLDYLAFEKEKPIVKTSTFKLASKVPNANDSFNKIFKEIGNQNRQKHQHKQESPNKSRTREGLEIDNGFSSSYEPQPPEPIFDNSSDEEELEHNSSVDDRSVSSISIHIPDPTKFEIDATKVIIQSVIKDRSSGPAEFKVGKVSFGKRQLRIPCHQIDVTFVLEYKDISKIIIGNDVIQFNMNRLISTSGKQTKEYVHTPVTLCGISDKFDYKSSFGNIGILKFVGTEDIDSSSSPEDDRVAPSKSNTKNTFTNAFSSTTSQIQKPQPSKYSVSITEHTQKLKNKISGSNIHTIHSPPSSSSYSTKPTTTTPSSTTYSSISSTTSSFTTPINRPKPSKPKLKVTQDDIMIQYPKSNVDKDNKIIPQVTIYRSDMRRLDKGEFLNDSIIEFYTKYIIDEYISEENKDRFFFFNSFFFKKLTNLSNMESSYSEIKKWTLGADIFQKDFVFVPINKESHWSLVIICFPGHDQDNASDSIRPCMIYLDSLYKKPNSIVSHLRKYLTLEWKHKRSQHGERSFQDPKKFPIFTGHVPMQQNYSDCGIFLLHYIELFCKNPEKKFPKNCAFQRPAWFPTSQTDAKRDVIRSLIYTLRKKHDPSQLTEEDEKTYELEFVETEHRLSTSFDTSSLEIVENPNGHISSSLTSEQQQQEDLELSRIINSHQNITNNSTSSPPSSQKSSTSQKQKSPIMNSGSSDGEKSLTREEMLKEERDLLNQAFQDNQDIDITMTDVPTTDDVIVTSQTSKPKSTSPKENIIESGSDDGLNVYETPFDKSKFNSKGHKITEKKKDILKTDSSSDSSTKNSKNNNKKSTMNNIKSIPTIPKKKLTPPILLTDDESNESEFGIPSIKNSKNRKTTTTTAIRDQKNPIITRPIKPTLKRKLTPNHPTSSSESESSSEDSSEDSEVEKSKIKKVTKPTNRAPKTPPQSFSKVSSKVPPKIKRDEKK
ncbi:hypothetical protein DLAC_07940 [Tieghemostelium lacteum]|uniref:Ubiquitin-like protease family profile domain-containing protein n=1 Tax=Tieghemostelium lacteum TaxID=361077 RepID=A0A151ZAR8_TIELA|nr:hypothetical protein DLAC_07940 [Tieghemostelium lacteum]|eukprot:KYQ91039.1 hypothetical protein DLAC_07940 [Tieghemostelium lacteum]